MKIQNALVSNILDRSQRYFARVTTVTLSWRVQNIVVIGRVYFTLECFEFSSNFEFDRNMLSGTGARSAQKKNCINPCATDCHETFCSNQYIVVTLYTVHYTICPKKYAHGFVVLCFVVVVQSFIMNSHEVFIHIHQGCFAGTGAIVRLPQCQWSKPDGHGKISQCIITTKHSKAKTVCIFLGIYCKYCKLLIQL